jgi:hypothetical protein
MTHLLIADAFSQIIGAIVALVTLVLWIVGQVKEAKKPGGQPRAAPRPQAPQAQRARPVGPAAGQQADPLRDQVEEFLRRAGKEQPANQARPAQRPAPARTPEIQLIPVDEPARAERRPLSEPFRPMKQPATAKSQPSAAPRHRPQVAAEPSRVSVADIAAGPRSLSRHASQLGQRIVADDEQFDVQLKAKFDHNVGTLAAGRTESTIDTVTTRDSPAAQIAAMLASPEGVRQAMVLNEILRRPSDRW